MEMVTSSQDAGPTALSDHGGEATGAAAADDGGSSGAGFLEMFFGDLHSSYVTYYLNVLG